MSKVRKTQKNREKGESETQKTNTDDVNQSGGHRAGTGIGCGR